MLDKIVEKHHLQKAWFSDDLMYFACTDEMFFQYLLFPFAMGKSTSEFMGGIYEQSKFNALQPRKLTALILSPTFHYRISQPYSVFCASSLREYATAQGTRIYRQI